MTETYDLVVYGATGFTGRQAAHYLAQHRERERFTFAVGGRSTDKLEAIARDTAADGVLVADGLDRAAIADLVSRTRVVATTAGPFSVYGDELVKACAEQGVHYADITGETPWVRTVIDRLHDLAAERGTRIVPFCGYDSIPSDIGALWIAQALLEETGQHAVRIEGYHRGRGGINGGTVASLLEMKKAGLVQELERPFLLDTDADRARLEPSEVPKAQRDPVVPRRVDEVGGSLRGFSSPFFMGPINTRVVRRSHALLRELPDQSPFGENLRYQEYWFSPGPMGWLESSAMSSFQGMSDLLMALPFSASLIEKLTPSPGSGPSERAMDGGFFRCDLIAHGEDGAALHGHLEGRGDPGNRITVKCLCESALAMALETERLSDGGGVLTPATALGLELVPRLEAAGIDFEIDRRSD